MKKTLLLIAVICFAAIGANAMVNKQLQYFACDFTDPSGWTSFGSGKTAADVYAGNTSIKLNEAFPPGEPPYQLMAFTGLNPLMCSNSTTVEGGPVSEWLVSPAIDLTDAPARLLLSFRALTYGSDRDAKFEVWLSTTGPERADFEQGARLIYSGKQANSATDGNINYLHKAFDTEGATQVWLAFVNISTDSQLLGFTDISLSEYDINVENNLPSFVATEGDYNVNLTADIMTAVSCPGFTATLSVGDEDVATFRSNKQLSTAYNTYSITFDKPIHIATDGSLLYTVTITPAYEGATPTVMRYMMVCTGGYESVCVEEEGTGSWCGWCPRGAAALGYFTDKYPERFIGIAVHSGDPMAISSYIDPLQAASGLVSFPSAVYNRSGIADAWSRETVEQILATRSGETIRIKDVTYDNADTGIVTVTYAPKLAYDTETANLTAVVVVTEDGCRGEGPDWKQVNQYSGSTQEQIETQFGEGSWPYFQRFGEAGAKVSDMTFDHVAQGIFNSFSGGGEGAMLPAKWAYDEEQEFTISFEMPVQKKDNGSGVQNWRNTRMAVMLIDRNNGKILTAAEMHADKYKVTDTGIEQIDRQLPVIDVTTAGDIISVTAPVGSTADLYTLTGTRVRTARIGADGQATFSRLRNNQPMVVRVTTGTHTYVKKIM